MNRMRARAGPCPEKTHAELSGTVAPPGRMRFGVVRQGCRPDLDVCHNTRVALAATPWHDEGMAGTSQTRTFADACLWVQEATDPDEVLRRANEGARLLLETSCSYCARLHGDTLRLVAHSGFHDPRTAAEWRLPSGEGVGGRVVRSGHVAVVRDFRHDPRRERFSKVVIDRDGLRSAVAAPLRSGERVVGVLYAADHQVRTFTSDEVELMTLFARAVSVMLEVAEQRRDRDRALQDLLRAETETEEAWRLLAAVVDALDGNGGLDAALAVLAGRFRAGVTVRNAHGQVVAESGEPGPAEIVVPIRSGGRGLGTLTVTSPDADRRSLEHVAKVIALWLGKARFSLEGPGGPEVRFLQTLLSSPPGSEAALAREASILELDLHAPRAVVCAGLDGPGPGSKTVPRAVLETLRLAAGARRLEPLLDPRGQDAVLVLRSPGPGGELLISAVSEMLEAVKVRFPAVRLVAGVGRVCRDLEDYPESFREAQLGVEVARAGGESVVTAARLGLYGLLARAVDPAGLDALAEETLAPLLQADARHSREYLRTLDAYLRSGGHLKSAAALLGLHVNTVRYRVARLQWLLGADLKDAEARFPIELAVRLRVARHPLSSPAPLATRPPARSKGGSR